MSGGAAERSGKIRMGDRILSVSPNDHMTHHMTDHTIRLTGQTSVTAHTIRPLNSSWYHLTH
jgi:C-terminal processing protease CtpA/Prc